MKIRCARKEELDEILRVYRAAKRYMDETGNPTQWEEGYPFPEMLCADIESGDLYVLADDTVHAVFYFALGEDETYQQIYEGAWKNDASYAVIHRVGSDGTARGVMREIVAFCKERSSNIRIDTHENNQTMQHVLEKLGFDRCGIIYLPNGDPRIAYQLCVE